jgi:hypothetical protein
MSVTLNYNADPSTSTLAFSLTDVASGRTANTSYQISDNTSVSGEVDLITDNGKTYSLVCTGSRLSEGTVVTTEPTCPGQ